MTLDSFFFPFPVIKMSTLFLTKYKLNMLVNLANPGLVISVSTACRYIDNLSLVPGPGADDADDDDEERLGGDQGVDEDSGPSPRPPHRARGQGTKEGPDFSPP